ncbi:MAG: hypothetical protein AB1560_10060 [Pseudomonadota bacterium]
MKLSRIVSCCVLLASLVCGTGASAAIDPAAAVVKVRKSCTENGVALDNCFTSLTAVTDWMATTRKPNASAPLEVEIGPGTFGQTLIECSPGDNYTGHTSFEGAGNGQTIIKGISYNSPLTVYSCTNLSFSHLTINGTLYGGVLWNGGGTSKWSDVEVIGAARAWYEEGCDSSRGSHYWFGSKLTAIAPPMFGIGSTYQATCDESWFFGSEITISVPTNAYQVGIGGAVSAGGNGIIHVYGSVLRALVDGPGSAPAARVGNLGNGTTGGEIHIHGTGIDLISQTGRNVVALKASDNGMIHANGATYNMSTTGTKTRIVNTGGHVHASYLWEEHAEAPAITSVNGADMAVVTNTADGQPHLVIYSSSCASKWFDTVTGACR